MDVDVTALATYTISEDGERVALALVDGTGARLRLRFGLADLGNLLMTLPGLIEAALRRRHRDASFRFAYPVASWAVEEASDPGTLILTLRTEDGFGVSFSMGRGNAEKLAHAMAGEGQRPPIMVTTH